MKRRFFLGGTAATLTTGLISGAASLSHIFSADAAKNTTHVPGACTLHIVPPPPLEELVNNIRTTLTRQGLMKPAENIVDFYNDIVDRYIAVFGEDDVLKMDGPYRDEIDEAAVILDDPKCFVAVPPEDGCTYFEAWKFFRQRDALKIFPAQGSVRFDTLSMEQQYFVATATVAYAGMLMNLFGSLTQKLNLESQLNAPIMALDSASRSLLETLEASGKCIRPVPGDKKPAVGAPVMVA